MKRDALLERYFTTLISGNRLDARQIVDELLQAECPAESILSKLVWPTLDRVQTLYRNDQLSDLAHHYATRLMRHQVDQLQLRLEQQDRIGRKVMFICGPEESEELGAQIACDLLEAAGHDMFFVGGGVANDELVAQLADIAADVVVVFGVVPSTVPFTRQLIDRIHDLDLYPRVQIVVGGGVFNRADGLAEEIGADLWASDPDSLVQAICENPDQRMASDQRTVGRKRKTKSDSKAA